MCLDRLYHCWVLQSYIVRSIRERRRLTQEGLARALGVSPRTIHRWESEATTISRSLVNQLARINGHTYTPAPHPVNIEMYKLSVKCQQEVKRAIKSGLLAPVRNGTPVKCVDCGEQAISYDHRDYFQPLVVDPVCGRCNALRGVALNTILDHKKEWEGYNWKFV